MRFNGQRLRAERRSQGIRVEALAVAVGRSVESIRGYEAGRIDPPAAIVARMAVALSIHPGDLFTSEVGEAA